MGVKREKSNVQCPMPYAPYLMTKLVKFLHQQRSLFLLYLFWWLNNHFQKSQSAQRLNRIGAANVILFALYVQKQRNAVRASEKLCVYRNRTFRVVMHNFDVIW